jgi:small subunit ribosomal protein S17
MAKIITGTVVSTKMQNTVVVRIERKYRHPTYRKVIIRHQKFKAHNDLKDINEGDLVTIQETRPISKDTYFRVVKKEADSKKVTI